MLLFFNCIKKKSDGYEHFECKQILDPKNKNGYIIFIDSRIPNFFHKFILRSELRYKIGLNIDIVV